MIDRFLCGATFCAALMFGAIANASPYTTLGRTIDLVPPTGYCALGETEDERGYLKKHQELTASTGVLLQVAIPCEDVKRFNDGVINKLTRQAVVSVMKAQGHVRLDNQSRSEFLRSLVQSFGKSDPVDFNKANADARQKLSRTNMSISLREVTPLGADDNAFYIFVISEVHDENGEKHRVVGVTAITLINGLTLNIQVSEPEKSTVGAPSPASVARQYLEASIKRNKEQKY